jgi:hypothetical protein
MINFILEFSIYNNEYDYGYSTCIYHTWFKRLVLSEFVKGKLRFFSGFYTGLLPTLARDLPFSGIYYMSYRKLKDIFSSDTSKFKFFFFYIPDCKLDLSSNKNWITSQASISVAAGLIASFLTQPADVIKTYRQVAPTDYQNVYITIKSIIKVSKSFFFSK